MIDDTTGNLARRHAVAKALLREMERSGGGWNARNMADAAIAALLPNRAAFAASLGEFAVAYRRYWDAQDHWFDHGRYNAGVPRLDRLLAELYEKERALCALVYGAEGHDAERKEQG